MTASTAAFSLTPGIQVSLASHFVDRRTACQVGCDSPPGARQSVYCRGGRKWPVRPGAQERHGCVTAVFIIERCGAPAVHLPSMTRPSGGHRQWTSRRQMRTSGLVAPTSILPNGGYELPGLAHALD